MKLIFLTKLILFEKSIKATGTGKPPSENTLKRTLRSFRNLNMLKRVESAKSNTSEDIESENSRLKRLFSIKSDSSGDDSGLERTSSGKSENDSGLERTLSGKSENDSVFNRNSHGNSSQGNSPTFDTTLDPTFDTTLAPHGRNPSNVFFVNFIKKSIEDRRRRIESSKLDVFPVLKASGNLILNYNSISKIIDFTGPIS